MQQRSDSSARQLLAKPRGVASEGSGDAAKESALCVYFLEQRNCVVF